MTFGEHYGLVDIRAAVTLGTWRHKGSGSGGGSNTKLGGLKGAREARRKISAT